MKVQDFNSNNISFYKYDKTKEIFPENIDDIKKALLKYEFIYPVSTGYNWGLGSKIPVRSNCIILNLSKMNKIVEYDESSGVVVIEPGVTQFQLAKFLEEKNSKYFLDVTGSSGETSIIGNTLERGIGYNKLRADLVMGIEIMSGRGDLLKTGSLRFDNSKNKYTYRYGVGADLTGLFFQSNFGIVTKLAIKLIKKKKYTYTVQVTFESEENLISSLNVFKKLLEQNVIDTIFHIANSERAIGAIFPYFRKKFPKLCLEKIEKILGEYISGSWSSAGVISGNNLIIVKERIKTFKNELSPNSKIKIVKREHIQIIEKILNFVPCFSAYKFLKVTKPFRDLYFGIPTNAALGIVNGIVDFKALEVDASEVGFLYCLPLTSLDGESCRCMLEVIHTSCEKYKFIPSITLNILSNDIIEAVVSISFNREESTQASLCIRYLQETLISKGHYPYRTNIKDMDLYFRDDVYNGYLKELKRIFDPKGKISPGRYVGNLQKTRV